MAEEKLNEQLLGILANVNGGQVNCGVDEDLLQVGVLTSITLMRLVAEIEKTFGISVSDSDMKAENFSTISQMAAFVDGKRSAI